jgi:hypothetical protein
MRPKWLLTLPDGKLMIEKSVEKINMDLFDQVILVCLEEHVEKYLTPKTLQKLSGNLGHSEVQVCQLTQPTASQAETVVAAINKFGLTGPIFIKDCDNMFNCNWDGKNEVAILDLNKIGLVDAKNKSYVTLDNLGNITNIIEKQVISNFFCSGGYGFESAINFRDHFNKINNGTEIYISHIVYSMLMSGITFKYQATDQYIDWGTLREFRHYNRSFVTVFCDVDGVLLYNGSKFSKQGWETEPIEENLNTISKLQADGRLYLIITTSRPESEKNYLEKKLAEFSVYPDKYVMDLPHTRRILINDFSSSNPFPTAISINLERDSKLLSSILDSVSE